MPSKYLLETVGQTFGRLKVVGYAERDPSPTSRCGPRRAADVVCLCSCGNFKFVKPGHLRGKAGPRSCGCLAREVHAARMRTMTKSGAEHPNYKHGHGRKQNKSKTYASWMKMVARCSNPNLRIFKYYGGRGIRVCDRWLSFENFLADMGERPNGMTLDRINVDGNYEPGNCRWATHAQQMHNRRDTVLNWDLVDEIRGRFEHGEKQSSIARRLGLRIRLVCSVVHQQTWKDRDRC